MTTALDALYRASVEVHRNLYRLALLNEISRNPAFVDAISRTAAARPMLTVRGSVAYAVTVSLAAVFDLGDTTASLRHVLSVLADRREEPTIRQLHTRTNVNVDLALERIRRLKKRLNSGEIQNAIGRLKKLRDQQLAHYDISPQIEKTIVRPGDIDRIFTFAANVVNTATVTGVKRLLMTRDSYEDACQQAREFVNSLMAS